MLCSVVGGDQVPSQILWSGVSATVAEISGAEHGAFTARRLVGSEVDHATIHRWTVHYAPLLPERLNLRMRAVGRK